MLTKTDKKWIEENIKPVRDSIDLLRGKISTARFDTFNTESRLNSIEASNIRTEEKIDKVLTILDGFAGKVADLDQENKMGARTLHRHGIQIHELAQATHTKISK